MTRFATIICSVFLFICTNSQGQTQTYVVQEWENVAVPNDPAPNGLPMSSDTWGRESTVANYSTFATTTMHHSGSRALKVELDNGSDSSQSTFRTEVKLWQNAFINQRYFYRFSVYLPDDNTCPHGTSQWMANWSIFAQWHGYPDFNLSEPYRVPPLSFSIDKNYKLHIDTHYSSSPANTGSNSTTDPTIIDFEHFSSGIDIPRGEWVDFEVSIRWDFDNDGYLDIWMNDNQIVNYNGPTCYNDVYGPYFKMGIYRPGNIVNQPAVIYFDNFQLLENGLLVFPVDDVFTQGGNYANSNFNYLPYLAVKSNLAPDYLKKTYLRFNYNKFSEYDFGTSELYLQPQSQSGNVWMTYIHRVTDNWSETNLTYNKANNELAVLSLQGIGDCSTNVKIPIPDAADLTKISLRIGLNQTQVSNSMAFPSLQDTANPITMQPILFLNF